MQVDRLGHGRAVAAELDVEVERPGQGRRFLHVADAALQGLGADGGPRMHRERTRELARVVDESSGRDDGRQDRASQAAVAVEVAVGEGRLEPPDVEVVQRAPDQRRPPKVVDGLGVDDQLEPGEGHAGPRHRVDIGDRVAREVQLRGPVAGCLDLGQKGEEGLGIGLERE